MNFARLVLLMALPVLALLTTAHVRAEDPPTTPSRPMVPIQPEVTVKGAVLMPDGSPAANAVIGTMLDFSKLPPTYSRVPPVMIGESLEVGSDGSFSGRLPGRAGMAVVAANADGSLIGWAVYSGGDTPALLINLKATVAVTGTVTAVEAIGKLTDTVVTLAVRHEDDGREIWLPACMWRSTTGTDFALRGPVGNVRVRAGWLVGEMTEGLSPWSLSECEEKLTLTVAEPPKPLALTIAPSALGAMLGKPMPDWTVTNARGTLAGLQPSDYRGKWLLVEFWGFW